jgi:hypothetical protein
MFFQTTINIPINNMVIIVFTINDKNGFYLYYIMLIAENIDVNIANKMYIDDI